MPPSPPTALLKGIEEEVLLGTQACRAVPLSSRLAARDAAFVMEPDGRNVEYVAGPHVGYDELAAELTAKRLALRHLLRDLGAFRVIPGATLPLEEPSEFHLSDPSDVYYRSIRDAYGDRVVTAGSHVSIGFDRTDELFRVYRILRCEAAMYLALSASSPFYRGRLSGSHSTRWDIFPHTPSSVPLFRDHAAYIAWVEDKLRSGEMFNRRHLWVAVRPNGPDTPVDLNRLELRICDAMVDAADLLSITALLEARVLFLLEHPHLDPVAIRPEQRLLEEIATNEAAAARSSLDAEVIRWNDGARISMRVWITEILAEVEPIACRAGLQERLVDFADPAGLESPAQRWIQRARNGESVVEILESEAVAAERRDGYA